VASPLDDRLVCKYRRAYVALGHNDRPIEWSTPPSVFFNTILLDHHKHGNVGCKLPGDHPFTLSGVWRVRKVWLPKRRLKPLEIAVSTHKTKNLAPVFLICTAETQVFERGSASIPIEVVAALLVHYEGRLNLPN